MVKLIVTADDYGMHPEIDSGVLQAHEKDMISGASIVPNGERFDSAIQEAKNHNLPLGVHLGLILERPTAPEDRVPSLINSDGLLPKNFRDFLYRYVTGQLRLDELKMEIRTQITRVRKRNVSITHIDSHQHLHLVPGIFEYLLELTEEFDIPAIRISDEHLTKWQQYLRPSIMGLKLLSRYARLQVDRGNLILPDYFVGLHVEELFHHWSRFRAILEDLAGLVEIGVHLAAEPVNDPYRFPNKGSFYGTYNKLINGEWKNFLERSTIELTRYPGLTAASRE